MDNFYAFWNISSVIVPARGVFLDFFSVGRSISTVDHDGNYKKQADAKHQSFVFRSSANAVNVAILTNVNQNEVVVPVSQIRRSRYRESPLEQLAIIALTFFFDSNTGSFDSFHILCGVISYGVREGSIAEFLSKYWKQL